MYSARPWGLYMARPTPGRAQFHYLESWLLPSLGLRASIFHFTPGHERDQDYYLDVADITTTSGVWETRDLYVDLVVRTGVGTELIDVDELLEAHRHGLVSDASAELAIQRSVTAVGGLARHNHDLTAWLASNGMDLVWK